MTEDLIEDLTTFRKLSNLNYDRRFDRRFDNFSKVVKSKARPQIWPLFESCQI